ncbi:hypothetical protein Tsubulata_025983 [Turnera subulata]|uniref:Uncharacterized protein n=1 Tax=Turnera subulata TaxID=218843 RepID=A0A9Q0JCZ9_9ROSI|nr:hypothetical protein Tsubulata_025983 [Turnera subulata]
MQKHTHATIPLCHRPTPPPQATHLPLFLLCSRARPPSETPPQPHRHRHQAQPSSHCPSTADHHQTHESSPPFSRRQPASVATSDAALACASISSHATLPHLLHCDAAVRPRHALLPSLLGETRCGLMTHL